MGALSHYLPLLLLLLLLLALLTRGAARSSAHVSVQRPETVAWAAAVPSLRDAHLCDPPAVALMLQGAPWRLGAWGRRVRASPAHICLIPAPSHDPPVLLLLLLLLAQGAAAQGTLQGRWTAG
jgi:hypothetical protein